MLHTIHTIHIQEDQVIIARLLCANKAIIEVQDVPTGKSAKVECTAQELAASLALAIGGDKIEGFESLYRLAEPLQARLRVEELRFIP